MEPIFDPPAPIPMLLWCPQCRARHIDVGEFATKPHHTHACQSCGMVWRPALVPTVGVQFLPGFKNLPMPAFETVPPIKRRPSIYESVGVPLINKPLHEIDFSVRAENVVYDLLGRSNFPLFVGDLVLKTEKDVLDARNSGKKTLREISEKIAPCKLGMQIDWQPPLCGNLHGHPANCVLRRGHTGAHIDLNGLTW